MMNVLNIELLRESILIEGTSNCAKLKVKERSNNVFRDLFKITAISRWYHHDEHVNQSNRRKEAGKSSLSYDDLKTLRKSLFWIFLISIFLNWGMIGAICAIGWIEL